MPIGQTVKARQETEPQHEDIRRPLSLADLQPLSHMQLSVQEPEASHRQKAMIMQVPRGRVLGLFDGAGPFESCASQWKSVAAFSASWSA